LDKKEARRAGLQARSALSFRTRQTSSHTIFLKLKERLSACHAIGIYISFRDEVETGEIIRYCFEHGIHVSVPRVEGNDLHFYEIHDLDDCRPGILGILEPYRGRETDVSSLDLMLVPLSSFDQHNSRTGYGRGYYDRILPSCRQTIGLAYSVQEVSFIETDPWDVRLHEVITEK
jgi:5-formyltetrahydrofolate cyclo-ligase